MADSNIKAQADNLREMAQRLQAQAEVLDPTPPTDSRQPGFNPEVEASHAATAAAAAAAATPATPAAPGTAEAAAPRTVNQVVADAVELINGLLGNVGPLASLIDELRNL